MVDYLKHPLDSCRERVRRAEEHMTELERQCAIIFEKHANAVAFDLDPNPPHRVINIVGPSETFAGMRLGTLTGEICYNLRTALDYLVFELAKLDTGTPQNGTQFPIMDAQKDFVGRGNAMLNGVNPAHVACIERLQPYNGCDWARRLRDLSNADKHRHLIPNNGVGKVTIHSSLDINLCRVRGAFERKARHPITGRNVDMKVHVFIQITFDDGAPIIETLHKIKTSVADTLRQFEPEF